MVDEVLFSSMNRNWGTPTYLFNWLDEAYNFDYDAAANENDTLCPVFLDSCLNVDWPEGVAYMNPPYGKSERPCKPGCLKKKCVHRGYHLTDHIPGTLDFVKKAYEQSLRGITVVCLLPVRTDTTWFNEYVSKASRLIFLKGRLRFKNAKNTAPFPSMIVVFNEPDYLRLGQRVDYMQVGDQLNVLS